MNYSVSYNAVKKTFSVFSGSRKVKGGFKAEKDAWNFIKELVSGGK